MALLKNILVRPLLRERFIMKSKTEILALLSLSGKIGTDLKDGREQYDGILGSQTREALEQAVEQGKTKEISEEFADKRIEYLRGLPIYNQNLAWEGRVEDLRDEFVFSIRWRSICVYILKIISSSK